MSRDSRIVYKMKDWSFIKNKVDNNGLSIDYEVKKWGYQPFVTEGNTRWFVNLYDPNHRKVVGTNSTDADYNDFVNNYKDVPDTTPPNHNLPVTMPDFISVTTKNKLAIHESSRPDVGGKIFVTYWTGAGDDITNHIIGAGDLMAIQTSVGTAESIVEAHFDSQFGDVYIHEGYAMWENGGWGDALSVEVIAPATQLQTSTDLDYELDGNKVYYASGGPGTGTHGLAGTPVLVPNKSGTGYWNYDGTNLTPNATQTGAYDFYNVEVKLSRFINQVPIMGTNYSYTMLQSADSSLIPSPYFIRITAHNNSDTVWKIWMIMTLYREKTV